jgi:ketosteroid isomerase-like protein
MYKKRIPLYAVLLPLLIVTVAGCGQSVGLEDELLEVDREFSRLSLEKGAIHAFYANMAENGRSLPKFGHPIARERYEKLLSEQNGEESGDTLQWQPMMAEVSASGDLGYTLGRYKNTIANAESTRIVHGYYVTIWKKQKDGTWKFVIDLGNESPAPEK